MPNFKAVVRLTALAFALVIVRSESEGLAGLQRPARNSVRLRARKALLVGVASLTALFPGVGAVTWSSSTAEAAPELRRGTMDFKQYDVQWGGHPYGGAIPPMGPCTYDHDGNPATPKVRCTIKTHGCLLSAVADVLAGYGIPTDPLLLHDAMIAAGWRDGYVDRQKVIAYSHLSVVPTNGYYPARALSYLANDHPVIVNLNTGGDGHWVVLTGSAPGGDFYILDPNSSKTLLSQYTTSQAQWLASWVINGGASIGAQAHSPVAMLLTDPLGRRTGYDPATGTEVNEIPSSSYGLMGGIENDETNTDGIPGLLTVEANDPIPGNYTLQITGTGTGSYEVDGWSVTDAGALTSSSSQGDATPGSSAAMTLTVEAPVSVGGIAEQPDVAALPAQLPTASSGHRTAYALGGAAAAALAIVAAGGWAMRRRRSG